MTTETRTGTRTGDGTMQRLLGAHGPHPDYADKLKLFGQFVGSWDLQVFAYPRDGERREYAGEWHFDWVLDGRTIQDVLITRPLDAGGTGGSGSAASATAGAASAPGSKGSTVRTYDPQTDTWWIVWQCPPDREFCTLFARADGDRIVLDGQWTLQPLGDRRFRWTFDQITPTSFRWRGEISGDRGETWHVGEEMLARRR